MENTNGRDIKVYYSFELKNKKTNELTVTKRGTFNHTIEKYKSFDAFEIQEKIRNMAKDYITIKEEYVFHANFYRIDE